MSKQNNFIRSISAIKIPKHRMRNQYGKYTFSDANSLSEPCDTTFQSSIVSLVVKVRCESADVTWTLSFSRDCEFDLDSYEIDDE